MHVNMGDLEPGDHQADAVRREPRRLLGRGHAMGHRHQMGNRLGVEIHPVVDLDYRHHQHVAPVEGSHVHEGDADVVSPYEAAGYLSVDDPGED